MTGEFSNPEDQPEVDPIKDIFIEDGLSGLLREPSDTPIDPLDEAIERGMITVDDAENFRRMRLLPEQERSEIFSQVAEAIQYVIDEQRVLYSSDTPLTRFFGAYFNNLDDTDGEGDFVPFAYFQDEGLARTGMTLEEWNELPESVKDTLRDVRYKELE